MKLDKFVVASIKFFQTKNKLTEFKFKGIEKTIQQLKELGHNNSDMIIAFINNKGHIEYHSGSVNVNSGYLIKEMYYNLMQEIPANAKRLIMYQDEIQIDNFNLQGSKNKVTKEFIEDSYKKYKMYQRKKEYKQEKLIS